MQKREEATKKAALSSGTTSTTQVKGGRQPERAAFPPDSNEQPIEKVRKGIQGLQLKKPAAEPPREKKDEKQDPASGPGKHPPPVAGEGKGQRKDDGDPDKLQNVTSFDDLGLSLELLRGIYAYGFERPSAIQQKAILPIMSGRDTIAQAQSGTGKTATFSIGLLHRVDTTQRKMQALVLAPTRELAAQSERVVKALGGYLDAYTHLCVGGTRVMDDKAALRGCHIAVGTPGRVFDLIRRGMLSVQDLQLLVMDEADEMLSRGFREQVQDIFQTLPESVQVVLVSATLPPEVLEVADQFMRDPVRILVKQEMVTLEGIKQFYVHVGQQQYKFPTVCDLYETLTIAQSVIFCNTRRTVDWLTDQMEQRDFTVSALHGDMDSSERSLIMQEFRSGKARVLITTDILARGIDVHSVSLVLNYDLPAIREQYVHRIGRGGRYGRKGVAINLVVDGDDRAIRELETFYDTQIKEMPQDIAHLM
jgi:translation initiation factor 4A